MRFLDSSDSLRLGVNQLFLEKKEWQYEWRNTNDP